VTDCEPDQELLARLRVADPASSLPSADPDRVARLLEAAMSDTDTTARRPESRETGTRDRSPLTWAVAAAAVLLIVAAGVLGLVQRDQGSTPTAQGSVTQLGYAGQLGRCMTPDARVLGEQSIAFRGRLLSVVDGAATVEVGHWYAGGPTDLAEVTAARTPMTELARSADLTVGRDYLVAAGDGVVTGCGLTGPASVDRQRLYERAFG
jgi:hypothetical protein